MDTQAESDNSNHFKITLEVIPDDPHDADPALVDAVGRDTVDALRNDGYTIEPVYTGTRGQYGPAVSLPVSETAPTYPKGIHEVSRLAAPGIGGCDRRNDGATVGADFF